jgi:hypothetical protein
MYMLKGAPVLRSALSGELRLELTYRDPSAQERAEELKMEVERPKLEVWTLSVDSDASESRRLTTHP